MPRPGGIVSAFGSLWVQSKVGHSLWRVSPEGHVIARFEGVSRPPPAALFNHYGAQNVVAGMGSIWVMSGQTVSRISPATNRVTARIAIDPGNETMVAGAGAVWATGNAAELVRIDPGTNTARTLQGATASASAIAFDDGLVWIGEISEAGGRYARFDPASETFSEIEGTGNDVMMLGAYHRVWVILGDRLAILRRSSKRLSGFKVLVPHDRPVYVAGMTSGLGRVWLNAGRLLAIDPATQTLDVDLPGVTSPGNSRPAGLAVLGHRVWMVDPQRQTIVGIDVCAEVSCS